MPEPDYDFSHFATPEETDPDRFPDLRSMSSGFLYRFVPVTDAEPAPPEYVYLRPPTGRGAARTKFDITLTSWNSMWESGELIPHAIDSSRMPRQLRWLRKVEGRNLRLVPRESEHRYDAYAPLYHLLPGDVLRAAGLPLLKRGLWPFWMRPPGIDSAVPRDFDDRLTQAFSRYLWPLLNGRSARAAFTRADPITVLSHHLDYWLPYIDLVAQRRMRANGRCEPERDDPTFGHDVSRFNEKYADMGVRAERPWRGGHLWLGEDEAWEAAQELVAAADEHGALRGVIDAVKSHRLQDDFSALWSYEREDFERKLHRKRDKVKVVFVELPDSVPVYSTESEVHDRLLWGDFMALLDPKERRVAVCLRRGTIGAVDIARELGYANHSPVSKRLRTIRKKAAQFFSLN